MVNEHSEGTFNAVFPTRSRPWTGSSRAPAGWPMSPPNRPSGHPLRRTAPCPQRSAHRPRRRRPLGRGRSSAAKPSRGAVDLRVILDNVKRTGQLRLYATRLTTDFSGQIAVELSASWLNDRPRAGPVRVSLARRTSRDRWRCGGADGHRLVSNWRRCAARRRSSVCGPR